MTFKQKKKSAWNGRGSRWRFRVRADQNEGEPMWGPYAAVVWFASETARKIEREREWEGK